MTVCVKDDLSGRRALEDSVPKWDFSAFGHIEIFPVAQGGFTRNRGANEDAALEIDRHEDLGARQQHLGAAEEEIATWVEREVEAAIDARLHLRVEVHEGVSTRDEVHTRDGSVLDEIVTAEDHRSPELLAHGQLSVHGLEVPLTQLLRDRLEGLRIVRPVACLRERFVVDV